MFWLLILLLAAVSCCYRWSRRRLYRLAGEIPFLPNSFPIIGHAHMFIGNSEDRMNALQKIGRVTNEQGGLLGGWLSNKLFICITDPTAIEVVTKACPDKDEFTMKHLRMVIGNGSLVAPVNVWRPRRKINAPFFSVKNLNRLVTVFDKKSSTMTDLMRAEVGAGDFPIWKYMTTFTFDSICETATGTKMNSQEHSDHYILRAVTELTHMVAKRMVQPWLHPDFVYEKLSVYKQFLHHKQLAATFIDEIVQNTRKKFAEATPKDENNNDKDWINFLEMVIHFSGGVEKGYSEVALREEATVMIAAGNDTSAVSASFAAVLLSRHPDVQERVHQELSEVFGDSDGAVTAEDMPRLKYLEAVIKETLRLYPPAPILVREVHKDVVLPSGTTLVDGTSLLINIWGRHRNPAYWGADADLFRPERFLEGPLRHPAQYLPFSYSVRRCTGSMYAMYTVKTALSNLIRRYRLLPPAGVRAADLTRPLPVEFGITMKAVDNFIVRVEERDNKTLVLYSGGFYFINLSYPFKHGKLMNLLASHALQADKIVMQSTRVRVSKHSTNNNLKRLIISHRYSERFYLRAEPKNRRIGNVNEISEIKRFFINLTAVFNHIDCIYFHTRLLKLIILIPHSRVLKKKMFSPRKRIKPPF